jgi:hypothetical protein
MTEIKIEYQIKVPYKEGYNDGESNNSGIYDL